MNGKIPKELAQKQELQRQTTTNIVLRAISELKAEGYIIRIKDLMDYTGLSRSVFGKEHVRKLLIIQGVVAGNPCESKYDCKSTQMTKEQRLRLRLKEKDLRLNRLMEENAELKSECELLRGRLFLLMQRQSWK